MERPWLVLLLVGCVLLAGCSLPGTGPADGTPTTGGSDGGDGAYPQGWNADGLANPNQSIQAADSAIAGQDFVERRMTVTPNTFAGNESVLVEVLVVRLDRDSKRLLSTQRFYRVTNETAGRVVDSGPGALDDQTPAEVRRTYYNESGGLKYHRLGNRSGVGPVQSGNYSSVTDQRMPALFATAVPMLDSGTFTGSTRSGSNVTYTVENVTAKPFESGSGQVTVREDGLVPHFAITQTGSAGPAAYTYGLESGDVTVEPPEWNASSGNASATATPGTTTPGTATPGTSTSTETA